MVSSLLLRASKNSLRAVARGADVLGGTTTCSVAAMVSPPPPSSTRTVSTLLVEQSSARQTGAQRRLTAAPLSSHANNTSATTAAVFGQQRRYLETEREFHPVADATLETIQDAVDQVFDSNSNSNIEYEVSLANGVLNLSLPPHGTWVINKQTPNRQIWVRA